MNDERPDPYVGLCELIRSLSKGLIMETSHVFNDLMDVCQKYGSTDFIPRDLILDFIRMLGQIARQMNAVVLPELISLYTDFPCLGCDGQPVKRSDVRKYLDRIDRAAKLLRTELSFRLPDEPALNYPPRPEFLPDERSLSFEQLITVFTEQTQILERYVNAFHADRPLGKDESSSLDAGALANSLASKLWKDQSDGPETELEEEKKDFDLAVKRLETLKSTVRTLLAEAVAYAKRHGSIHLSTCCDLQHDFKAGRIYRDFSRRLRQTLDDIWQESMSKAKGPGNGAGRKRSAIRNDQVAIGVEKKLANPSQSNLSIARNVLMFWEKVHGPDSAKLGYPNTESGIKLLAGEIDRSYKKQSRGSDRSSPPSNPTAAV